MKQATFKELREHWERLRPTLSKEDVKKIAGKDTFRGKMKGFLTPSYWKREKLIRNSEVVMGLVFKEWRGSPADIGNCYRDWILFSPSIAENMDTSFLYACAEKVLKENEHVRRIKEERRFFDAVQKPLSDASYLRVPEPYSDGHLVYLSIVERPYDIEDSFLLGLKPILVNKSISKEILFLPETYQIKEEKENG